MSLLVTASPATAGPVAAHGAGVGGGALAARGTCAA